MSCTCVVRIDVLRNIFVRPRHLSRSSEGAALSQGEPRTASSSSSLPGVWVRQPLTDDSSDEKDNGGLDEPQAGVVGTNEVYVN